MTVVTVHLSSKEKFLLRFWLSCAHRKQVYGCGELDWWVRTCWRWKHTPTIVYFTLLQQTISKFINNLEDDVFGLFWNFNALQNTIIFHIVQRRRRVVKICRHAAARTLFFKSGVARSKEARMTTSGYIRNMRMVMKNMWRFGMRICTWARWFCNVITRSSLNWAVRSLYGGGVCIYGHDR